MVKPTAWHVVMDISSLVRTAYGLALLADYDCSDKLCNPAEREAAQEAPMSAARLILAQAGQLLDTLELLVSDLEKQAALLAETRPLTTGAKA